MTFVREDNFDKEVLQSPLPVFVDCYAEWCAPCKALKPVLLQIQEDYKDKVKVVFFDVEQSMDLSVRLGVSAVPKVCVFYKGQEIASFLGLTSKADLLAVLEDLGS